jgi:hypothetical protein
MDYILLSKISFPNSVDLIAARLNFKIFFAYSPDKIGFLFPFTASIKW